MGIRNSKQSVDISSTPQKVAPDGDVKAAVVEEKKNGEAPVANGEDKTVTAAAEAPASNGEAKKEESKEGAEEVAQTETETTEEKKDESDADAKDDSKVEEEGAVSCAGTNSH